MILIISIKILIHKKIIIINKHQEGIELLPLGCKGSMKLLYTYNKQTFQSMHCTKRSKFNSRKGNFIVKIFNQSKTK